MYTLSHVWLFATPWIVAHQAPLSMGFSRWEYWIGLPFFLTQESNLNLLGLLHWQILYQLKLPGKPVYVNATFPICPTLSFPRCDYKSILNVCVSISSLSDSCELVPGKEPQVIPVRENFQWTVGFPRGRCGRGWEAGSAPGQCLVSGRPLPLSTTKEITATGGEQRSGRARPRSPEGGAGVRTTGK